MGTSAHDGDDFSFDSQRQLDELCDRFEANWRSHGPASIKEAMDAATAHRAELFRMLLVLDIEYRHRNGKKPDPDFYCSMFPQYAGIVAGVFNTESMRSPRNQPLQTDTLDSENDDSGKLIGAFKILQQIGEGGFGVVYMAEQSQPFQRRVALKIIKPGMDSKEVVARFEAERQALALMDHPNIAKVLDAGSGGESQARQTEGIGCIGLLCGNHAASWPLVAPIIPGEGNCTDDPVPVDDRGPHVQIEAPVSTWWTADSSSESGS